MIISLGKTMETLFTKTQDRRVYIINAPIPWR
jgi:hypothetical protein